MTELKEPQTAGVDQVRIALFIPRDEALARKSGDRLHNEMYNIRELLDKGLNKS